MAQPLLKTDDLYHSKILIVDDTDFGRILLKTVCNDAGFDQLEEAQDGKEALDIVIQWKPDLVFLDVHMPNMNGMELCEALKDHVDMNDIVIIMQTGDDKEEFKVQAFQAGVTDFIRKPLNKAEVQVRAVSHLERLHLKRQANKDHVRIMQELEEAQALQHILLPKEQDISDLHQTLGVDVAYHYQPASELGGDYISVQQIDDHRLAVILVDICGHGVPAALYAFALHMLFQEEKLGQDELSDIMAKVNKRFHKFVYPGKFATVFLGMIDCEKDSFHYVAAGAPKPLFLSDGSVEEIDTTSYLLGMDKHSEFHTVSRSFKPGDALFLYSDALTETEDEHNRFLDISAIGKVMNELCESSSSDILDAALKRFEQHNNTTLRDDLSLLVCKR